MTNLDKEIVKANHRMSARYRAVVKRYITGQINQDECAALVEAIEARRDAECEAAFVADEQGHNVSTGGAGVQA